MGNRARGPASADAGTTLASTDGSGRQTSSADAAEREVETTDHPETDLSADEIIARYYGQWVLLKFTADQIGSPEHGEVLAHAESRAPLHKKLLKILGEQRGRHAGYRYTIFEAYPRIRTGAELRAALEEAWRTWPDEAFERR